MLSLEKLSKRVLEGKKVTLWYHKQNDGTEDNPDIMIKRVYVETESNSLGYKSLVVYLSSENEKSVFGADEIYRMPFVNNLNILKYILKEIKKQAHSP